MRHAHPFHFRSADESHRYFGFHVAGVADRGQVSEAGLAEHEGGDYACYEPEQADEFENGGG